MNYAEGVKHMKYLSDKSGSFVPYSGITINYPGRKQSGDYRLSLASATPTHGYIARTLYSLINNGNFSFDALKKFLSDIYTNGTATPYKDSQLEYLKHLIFWITLQEEINYPRIKGFAGINLAFCRFVEAIYSTLSTSSFDIETVTTRCHNNGRNKALLYSLENAPEFYHY